MTERYQQFLGSRPGLVVEVADDAGSPYRVRTDGGFEFFVSAEDFRNYYKKEGTDTPDRWRHLVTEPETGMIHSGKMSEVLKIVQVFLEAFQDYEKARAFVREGMRLRREHPDLDVSALRARLEQGGWKSEALADKTLETLFHVSPEVQPLLLSDSCGVLQEPAVLMAGDNGSPGGEEVQAGAPSGGAATHGKAAKTATPQTRRAGMKNVEMTVEQDQLTLVVDLSKEFGPSKSGKTTIIASSEGNKSVPGRNEKVGLNIYKAEGKKAATGRKDSFKNVHMDVQGDTLKLTVDLSKEWGPSKSGKTIIIASTEGNQLIFGRQEKIGLNVYKKIE
jgi:hypothetical protein